MSGTGKLVKLALNSSDNKLTNDGALSTLSGKHTGRCPEAKYIVKDKKTEDTVDWSENQSMTIDEWSSLCQEAEHYMSTHTHYGKEFQTVYAAAGKITKWETRTKKVFKFICENSKQELFIQNMFEKEDKKPSNIECEVYCLPGLRKEATVAINFSEKKIIICGTQYLGEIKKSVFTYMNYILTDAFILPMHCSINVDENQKNPAIFFGLSGTGKTTLSSSPDRVLLGDDEHGWTDGVLFNIESGCYAKTIDLTPEREPEIFKAANRFGSILENVVVKNGIPDFHDDSITKNGRASYPITHLDKYIESGCVFEDPVNVIMLTCDAFGVLPPVSKLSIKKAKEMFLVGYTSKVAGTEVGITEPSAVFSPCFGAPFLPRNPSVYGNMLESFLKEKNISCWLVNTGWTGGPYGVGDRISLSDTRAIISSILNGTLDLIKTDVHKHTGLDIPRHIPGLEGFETHPEKTWKSAKNYKKTATSLMNSIKEKMSSI